MLTMAAVYGTKGSLDQQLLSTMKAALRSIADVTDLLNNTFPLEASISRLSGSLHLLHHQVRLKTSTSSPSTLLTRTSRYSALFSPQGPCYTLLCNQSCAYQLQHPPSHLATQL